MFLFFSNKLGCLGSILVSVVLTLLVLLFFGVLSAGGTKPRHGRAAAATLVSMSPFDRPGCFLHRKTEKSLPSPAIPPHFSYIERPDPIFSFRRL